jgi:hypothetical protein
MRSFVLVCVLALAAAAPRISLDLDESVESYKLAKSITRKHDLGYTQPGGAAVKSRQVIAIESLGRDLGDWSGGGWLAPWDYAVQGAVGTVVRGNLSPITLQH